ncbi:MAG: c-type cytochrome [Candidatus Poribacteria bacterium]|nr:c-type cytochrome [Candidatus Poribacteria bacterium]MDE0502919.1 c-type cytochrome [Candidatus Poribacteria bacterium]
MSNTITKIASLVVMIVSFIAYVAKAPAFPIASENLLPWSTWFFISTIANIILWQRVMKLLAFALLVIWFYAFAASIVPETSTARVILDDIPRTEEAFVEAGEAIFNGKGKCNTCHTLDPSAPKGRCPDLSDIGVLAGTRQPGVSTKDYLIESTYEPHKFLVPGYGNIMPPVWKPPISLTELEIETVIAFLQFQGGEVDLTKFEPPVDIGSAITEVEVLPPLLLGDVERGKRVFVDGAKCIACHAVAGIEQPAGQTLDDGVEVVAAPDLTDIASLNSMRYIEESIVKPNALIVSGYGSVTVKTNGASIQGTLTFQDEEKITVRVKDAGGIETEQTLLLSELDPEPIEELTNLKDQGYFWIEVNTADTGTKVRGDLADEDAENVIISVDGETQTISKSNVQVQATIIDFDGNEIVGELVSENEDEVTLMVDGEEQVIDTFDIDEGPIYGRALGKRLSVTSPMPDNFPLLLSVADMSDLLAYLASLTGATEETVAEAGASAAEAEDAAE